jgi:spermidine/putrescine transport system substrate-binding protein
MGFTYNPEFKNKDGQLIEDADELVSSWECLWNNDIGKIISLKDSVRDTYVVAIFHVYKDEIAVLDETAPDYNSKLSAIFNRCDDATIEKVKNALLEAKRKTVYGLEVDEGKNDIVNGDYFANLAWSGDAIYAMDSAEENEKPLYLNYSLPEEGSNVWFDGWCMPKGANKELAEEFVNFICDPENAALCMDEVGYTSPIVGEDIWELVNDWYAAD